MTDEQETIKTTSLSNLSNSYVNNLWDLLARKKTAPMHDLPYTQSIHLDILAVSRTIFFVSKFQNLLQYICILALTLSHLQTHSNAFAADDF